MVLGGLWGGSWECWKRAKKVGTSVCLRNPRHFQLLSNNTVWWTVTASHGGGLICEQRPRGSPAAVCVNCFSFSYRFASRFQVSDFITVSVLVFRFQFNYSVSASMVAFCTSWSGWTQTSIDPTVSLSSPLLIIPRVRLFSELLIHLEVFILWSFCRCGATSLVSLRNNLFLQIHDLHYNSLPMNQIEQCLGEVKMGGRQWGCEGRWKGQGRHWREGRSWRVKAGKMLNSSTLVWKSLTFWQAFPFP